MARIPPSLVIAGGLAGSSALNLAGLLLWVRILSPAAFGTLSLVTSAALMLNALGFEWLRLAGARSLIDPATPTGVSPARLSAWIALAALLAAFLAAVTAALTLVGVAPPGLRPHANAAILLLALSEMPFAAVTLVARLCLSATSYAAAMIARSALALAAGLALLAANPDSALAIVAATALAQLAVSFFAITRNPLWRAALAQPSIRADRTDLVRLGIPLIAGSALALAAATIDRLLVASHAGLAAAGHYAAAAELVAKTLGFALMAINLSAYPLLVRCFERDGPAAAAAALERNLAVLLAAALPILLATLLFARPLARALLGEAVGPLVADLLPWLAGATLLRLLVTFHFAIALQLARRMSLLLVPPAITLAVLVQFAPAALASGGLAGFARLLFAAQGSGTIAAWVLARRALPVRAFTPATARLLALALLVALAARPFRPPG